MIPFDFSQEELAVWLTIFVCLCLAALLIVQGNRLQIEDRDEDAS